MSSNISIVLCGHLAGFTTTLGKSNLVVVAGVLDTDTGTGLLIFGDLSVINAPPSRPSMEVMPRSAVRFDGDGDDGNLEVVVVNAAPGYLDDAKKDCMDAVPSGAW